MAACMRARHTIENMREIHRRVLFSVGRRVSSIELYAPTHCPQDLAETAEMDGYSTVVVPTLRHHIGEGKEGD